MITKLKRRFIILAMVSLTVLLAAIVAGMNIANYNKVVSDADTRLEALEKSADRMLGRPDGFGAPFGGPAGAEAPDEFDDPADLSDGWDDVFDDLDDGRFDGRGGHAMTRDEAEESRFFMVALNEDGSVRQTNVDRISSVDASEAETMAEEAASSGETNGFIGDFRYSVSDASAADGGSRITFLDCGRTLEAFRSFLRASVIASLAGLLLVFFVMLYFAGRIVQPVAESYEKQKRFITDAGHEIKTPLAIIKANIDLMDMQLESGSADAEDMRDSLNDIDEQVDRLTGLTNDLVYLSRMEEAESTLVMTDVPLSDIMSETVASFEPLAKERGKEIDADIAEMVSVRGSHKELEKLVSIILENAVKYSACRSGEQGVPRIDVSLKKEGRSAVIEVSNDTEGGLMNESLSHVFERFYRTDSSRNSATGGHGIGLSMANAIVNAHGGKISARTTDGSDFIVTATLPLS